MSISISWHEYIVIRETNLLEFAWRYGAERTGFGSHDCTLSTPWLRERSKFTGGGGLARFRKSLAPEFRPPSKRVSCFLPSDEWVTKSFLPGYGAREQKWKPCSSVISWRNGVFSSLGQGPWFPEKGGVFRRQPPWILKKGGVSQKATSKPKDS